jgi:hypothetical protein
MTENGDIVNRNPRSVRVVGADNTAGEEAIRRMTRQRVDQAEEEAVHEDKELFGDAVSRSGLKPPRADAASQVQARHSGGARGWWVKRFREVPASGGPATCPWWGVVCH